MTTPTIQFQGDKILFNGSNIAMDPACCCGEFVRIFYCFCSPQENDPVPHLWITKDEADALVALYPGKSVFKDAEGRCYSLAYTGYGTPNFGGGIDFLTSLTIIEAPDDCDDCTQCGFACGLPAPFNFTWNITLPTGPFIIYSLYPAVVNSLNMDPTIEIDSDSGEFCASQGGTIGELFITTNICDVGAGPVIRDEDVNISVTVKNLGAGSYQLTILATSSLCGNPVDVFYGQTTFNCGDRVIRVNNLITPGDGGGSPITGSPGVTNGGFVDIGVC